MTGIVLLSGCREEIDYGIGEYRVDWVKVESNKVFSLLDSRGTTLYNAGETAIHVNAGDRIVLNYSYIDAPTAGFDRSIRINGGSPVMCGNLKMPVTLQELSRLKDDPIIFESAWIGRGYLNISFYLDMKGESQHSIQLLRSPVPCPTDPDAVCLLFRHDNGNDPAGSRRKLHASFDISALEAGLSQRIVLRINPSNYRDSIITVSQ
jgi:hypothetical protein